MNEAEYYEALEFLVKKLSHMENAAVPGLGGAADPICKALRIAYLDVKQFHDFRAEQRDEGMHLDFYDSRQLLGQTPVVLRIKADNRSIIRYRAYPAKTAEPWNEQEEERIRLLLDTLYQFTSRSRLLKLINKFTYFDDAGYRNIRFFMRHALDLSDEGTLEQMNAFALNLNHFGIINQQIGRKRGDQVMRRFYDGMQELLGKNGWICRTGGDNFLILARKECTDSIVKYISGTPVVFDDQTNEKLLISGCAGIFEIPNGFEFNSESSIMDPIMSSMQIARKSLSTNVVRFSNRMFEEKQHISQIQQEFREALKNDEILVYYQPKIALGNRTLGGAEALCRWNRGGRIIPPMDFIPILESGMEICSLDFHMLDKVCRDIRRWLDEGKPVVRISVNFSRRHMADLELLEHILEIVDRNHVPHEYIEIELTETTTDVEFNYLQQIVHGLQLAGICTSVDDFGIGYSSLKLIKEIPWNVLKVDKSFLPEMDEPAESRRSVMFRHVISMVQDLGLDCVTEGVETAEQVQLLLETGCEMAQGFYFDKPMPVEEFEYRLPNIHYA